MKVRSYGSALNRRIAALKPRIQLGEPELPRVLAGELLHQLPHRAFIDCHDFPNSLARSSSNLTAQQDYCHR
jgi:hypothetical protein